MSDMTHWDPYEGVASQLSNATADELRLFIGRRLLGLDSSPPLNLPQGETPEEFLIWYHRRLVKLNESKLLTAFDDAVCDVVEVLYKQMNEGHDDRQLPFVYAARLIAITHSQKASTFFLELVVDLNTHSHTPFFEDLQTHTRDALLAPLAELTDDALYWQTLWNQRATLELDSRLLMLVAIRHMADCYLHVLADYIKDVARTVSIGSIEGRRAISASVTVFEWANDEQLEPYAHSNLNSLAKLLATESHLSPVLDFLNEVCDDLDGNEVVTTEYLWGHLRKVIRDAATREDLATELKRENPGVLACDSSHTLEW